MSNSATTPSGEAGTVHGAFPSEDRVDHWVLRMSGVNPAYISKIEDVLVRARAIVSNLGLNAVAEHGHYFGPGVSAIIIISESHLSFHTWPEDGYVYADLATCTRTLDRDQIGAVFSEQFGCSFFTIGKLK